MGFFYTLVICIPILWDCRFRHLARCLREGGQAITVLCLPLGGFQKCELLLYFWKVQEGLCVFFHTATLLMGSRALQYREICRCFWLHSGTSSPSQGGCLCLAFAIGCSWGFSPLETLVSGSEVEFKLSEYSPLCQIKWFVKVRPDLWGESIFFIRSTDVEKADKLSGILTLLPACVCIARMKSPVCQGRLCFKLCIHSDCSSVVLVWTQAWVVFLGVLVHFLGRKTRLPLCLDTRCYYRTNNGLCSAADSLCKSGANYWIPLRLDFHL